MSQRPEFFPARELFDRLVAEQRERPNRIGIAWLFAEREAMLETANQACEKDGRRPMTMDDVLLAENRASGHADYTTQFAINLAEMILRQPRRR